MAINVYLERKGQAENKISIANLSCNFLSYNWNWGLTLKSFEPIHGMSRIVKMTPDKLATAIAISIENLPGVFANVQKVRLYFKKCIITVSKAKLLYKKEFFI